ncbi:MAG: hypothetical protein ACREE7_11115 [Dongiaceae bacterium]
MRPIRRKTAPAGIFPKRFLISTLRQLGQEVGLTVPTLVAPPNGSGATRALSVRLHVYRGGCEVHQLEVAADPRRPCIEVWQGEWEAGLAPANVGEDLIAVEYLHAPADAPWLGPRMAEEVEGQFLARAADGRYGCVLTSFVPFRPAGYKFTPIIGLTHYHKFGPEFENYALFVNLKGAGAADDGANRLHIDYYGFSGARLATADLEVPYNSGYLHAVEASLAERGVAADALAGGVISHCRGGASQFSIFTLIRNRRTGALGLEHSLPPYYYVTGISHPDIRGPLYARALAPA